MTDRERKDLQITIRRVTARVGSGRQRRFATPIDLSPAAVDRWRAEMGLPPIDRSKGK